MRLRRMALSDGTGTTTAVYDEEGTEGRFAHRRIRTSFLQRLRPTARTFRTFLPLYHFAERWKKNRQTD